MDCVDLEHVKAFSRVEVVHLRRAMIGADSHVTSSSRASILRLAAAHQCHSHFSNTRKKNILNFVSSATCLEPCGIAGPARRSGSFQKKWREFLRSKLRPLRSGLRI